MLGLEVEKMRVKLVRRNEILQSRPRGELLGICLEVQEWSMELLAGEDIYSRAYAMNVATKALIPEWISIRKLWYRNPIFRSDQCP